MRFFAAFCACVATVLAVTLAAQDRLYFPPADRMAVRAMRDVPPIELAPGVHVRTVIGEHGAFSLADFDPGASAVLHHHTREQADIATSGRLEITLGTHVERLAPGAGVIVPADVDHAIANRGNSLMTVIEFHTAPRPDLVPPRPALTWPVSPQPVAIPDSRRLVARLDGSDETTLHGETCTMTWRRLRRGTMATLHPTATRTEQYIYVISGEAALLGRDATIPIRDGRLVVMPGPEIGIHLQISGSADLVLVEFTPDPLI